MKVSPLDGVRHPKIYAFTTPEYSDTEWVGKRPGKGLLKVGYTDRDVRRRVAESLQGVKMPTEALFNLLLTEPAVADDGSAFMDHSVHKQLVHAGVHRLNGEWFECTTDEVKAAVAAVRAKTMLPSLKAKRTFGMRPEQQTAVEVTRSYFQAHADEKNPPQYLWNAKMRFGKTFATYQLAKAMDWSRVLVLTYKPAVERAWREDLEEHADFTNWRFKGKRPEDADVDLDDKSPLIWFASFQDVLGTDSSGAVKLKNEGLYMVDWDCVVIDEYHFGAWRDAARGLYVGAEGGDATEKSVVETPDLEEDFTQSLKEVLSLSVHNYLFLSGTPFRALTEGEFLEDQVFNWTYSDEQGAKEHWKGPEPNPYLALPKMHMLVYAMPDKLREIALNNNSEFSLTEFFRTQRDAGDKPRFLHEAEVQKWLDLLRGQDIEGLWASVSSNNRPPLPFEDTNLLRALQHTAWYLPGVDACLAMRDLMEASHNVFFRDYKIVVAAGQGVGMGEAALPPVEQAIGPIPQDTKTITLTCGKLMTGVTVPAWAGIFMLRELQSPESYFQAAFRVQSPWATVQVDAIEGGEQLLVLKDHCYVLDFSPNRALRQIVDYATRLRAAVAAERDDEAAIAEFMEFLPVLSFDGYTMARLEAADVVDFLTRGISSTMLARRWNSPELLTLDLKAMEALLGNPGLLDSLEQVELFRQIRQDLTALVNTHKELGKKKLAKEPLTSAENQADRQAKKVREDLKARLRRFLTRIPAFMYLTDYRERSVKDLITQVEPDLFKRVTQLSIDDFSQLLAAGVFSDSKMNDAVWKFRAYEEPSLSYDQEDGLDPDVVGGWSVGRNPRFARLIEAGVISFGDTLAAASVTAEVSEDYGLLVDGIRYASPAEAAADFIEAGSDGWSIWRLDRDGEQLTLSELEAEAGLSVTV